MLTLFMTLTRSLQVKISKSLALALTMSYWFRQLIDLVILAKSLSYSSNTNNHKSKR